MKKVNSMEVKRKVRVSRAKMTEICAAITGIAIIVVSGMLPN